jgi:hypothetical protein
LSRLTTVGIASLGISLGRCASEPSAAPVIREESVEVNRQADEVPGGTDTPPRFALALRAADGTRTPLESRALAHVTFNGGLALVDSERRLVVVAADGARRVLAEEAGAPPARGPRGELVYVAQKDSGAEVRILETGGADRVIATGLASAGLLAPQPDGRTFFVGARNGGVAGLWRIGAEGSRCLTNCDLETGQPWGDRFVPPPGEVAAIKVVGTRVEWDAHDGRRYGVSLGGAE